jgi:hypothetical protein
MTQRTYRPLFTKLPANRESRWLARTRARLGWRYFAPAVVAEAQKNFVRCDLQTTYWSALEPAGFFKAKDIVMYTHVNEWIYIWALNEAACQIIPQATRDAMEWDNRQL